MRNKFRTVRKRIADINSSVENSIQGIREVKSYANEDYAIEKFGEANMGFLSAKEDMYKVMAKFHSGMIFFIESYQLVVIGTGAYLIRKGELDLADVIAFLMYFRFSMMPIRKLVNFIEQFQQGVAAFERFDEVMKVEPDIIDRENPVVLDNVKGNINFSDVSFKYEGCDEWILEDINIKIDKGKTIALVGESGAGKSSLASLIPRFYEVQKGIISLDGINIMDLEQKTLRENIGIVQQNIFLFDTTIRENIMFGNPEATEEELVLAAKSANIFDYIMTLPDQFETVVGERGVKLSGGQKQRISIARAFLKNPPVLIFDEATSSLDTESESLITDSMEKLCENRTTIIIAHRLSTVRNADYTYVLKSGKIIEHGPHEDLIKSEGYYKSLYTKSMF
jgi:ATP-binding cassette subfamily B protein